MRVAPAPWVADVISRKRPISEEELCWMFQQLIVAMKLEDEFAMRKFQSNLARTLGTINSEHDYEGSERWSPELGDEVYRNGEWVPQTESKHPDDKED